jgi:hypothetical protein
MLFANNLSVVRPFHLEAYASETAFLSRLFIYFEIPFLITDACAVSDCDFRNTIPESIDLGKPADFSRPGISSDSDPFFSFRGSGIGREVDTNRSDSSQRPVIVTVTGMSSSLTASFLGRIERLTDVSSSGIETVLDVMTD